MGGASGHRNTSQGAATVPNPASCTAPATAETEFSSRIGSRFRRPQRFRLRGRLYQKVLAKAPHFAEVLEFAGNLTTKGRLQDGLAVRQAILLRRDRPDPTAHYNLACRYAL